MKVLFTKKSNRKISKIYMSSILCLPEIFKIAFLLLIQIHGTTNTTLKKTITFYFGSLFLVIKELTIKFFTITWLCSGQEIYHHLVAIWRFFWHPFALYYNDSKEKFIQSCESYSNLDPIFLSNHHRDIFQACYMM